MDIAYRIAVNASFTALRRALLAAIDQGLGFNVNTLF